MRAPHSCHGVSVVVFVVRAGHVASALPAQFDDCDGVGEPFGVLVVPLHVAALIAVLRAANGAAGLHFRRVPVRALLVFVPGLAAGEPLPAVVAGPVLLHFLIVHL